MSERSEHFYQPGEWALHDAVWLAWPSHENLWQEDLPEAQKEFTELCRGIFAGGKGERLEILVPDAAAQKAAEKGLAGLGARFHSIPFGDIWLRDTAPIFKITNSGEVSFSRFQFNGWGGKYKLPHDAAVSAKIGEASGLSGKDYSWVLEGGSIESDGEGTCLTTRQCLLNPNRNPKMPQAQVEAALRESLGFKTVLWLGDGLLNDHTDGHIDTIARFVAPGVVVCMEARSPEDPNRDVLAKIASDLSQMKDAQGRTLEVVRIPSPGKVLNEDGDVMPASYVNFYIGNQAVIVPTYGTDYDQEAVAEIAKLFPERKTIGVSAIAILTGGGAFHCITQQQPSGRKS